MPEITTNIELVKIQSNENYNVAIENENLDKIDAAVGGKVDKAVGKGLSTEDYSTAEKNKLAGIEALVAGLYALKAHNHDLVYSPYVHNHDAAYLGKTAKASDSGKLNGQLAAYYAIAGHNHSGVYEPVITKKSGFNLDKSDSVTSTSSTTLATSKATKVAFEKGAEALSIANGKEPVFSKNSAFNLNKSNSISSSSSSTLATSAAARTAYNKGVEALNKVNSIPNVTINSRPSSGMKVGHINIITT